MGPLNKNQPFQSDCIRTGVVSHEEAEVDRPSVITISTFFQSYFFLMLVFKFYSVWPQQNKCQPAPGPIQTVIARGSTSVPHSNTLGHHNPIFFSMINSINPFV